MKFNNLPDVQQQDQSFIKRPIEKVGVRGIRVPMFIKQKDGDLQPITATVSSYCNLVEGLKGINMSRIGRTINNCLAESTDGLTNLYQIAQQLVMAHETTDVYVKCKFTYFVEQRSPITQLLTREPIDVVFETRVLEQKTCHFLTVVVAGMSLCPCSKEMSLLTNNISDDELFEINSLSPNLQQKIKKAGFGAHNQNSTIKVTVELIDIKNVLWIEDLYDALCLCFSSPTYNILKRPDEKFVTEVSYMGGFFEDGDYVEVGGGAKFVEDIAREASCKLDEWVDTLINDYVVVVNNDESIHKEDIQATAIITAGRTLR